MDIVGNLPREISEKILITLSPDDVYNAWYCCKRWRYQMAYSAFWKMKCKVDGFREFEESARSETYNKCIQHYPIYWMGHYMYCRALYSNWKNNVCEKITVSGGKVYIAIRYLDDEIAILVTMYNNLVVLDSNTGEVQKMYVLDEPVLCDIEKYDDLVVGRGERSLKVWNIKTKECVFQYSSEHDLVKSITIFKNFVVTRNEIASLCVIDMKTSKILYRRNGVDKVCFDNDILALAKSDDEIEILDLNFSLVHVLKAESNIEPLQIVIKGDYLIYFTRYKMPRYSRFYFAIIWNARTGKLLRKIEPIFHYRSCIFLREDQLIYSTEDDNGKEAFKLCNFITGEVLITIHASSPFTAANNTFMFMESEFYGTADGWCLKTGKLIIKANIANCLGFQMTERKFAYFDDHTMNFHILNYEHELKY